MGLVIVGGALANKNRSGGEAWVRLSWVRGLQRLGFDVLFAEEIESSTCIDESGAQAPFAVSANADYFRRVTEAFGLADRAVLVCRESKDTIGLAYDDLLERAEDAQLLVNISGHLKLDDILRRVRLRAYVDIDPGFTQFWHSSGVPGFSLAGHHLYFTIAENIGRRTCRIPTCEIAWRPVRQPVVLDDWPVSPAEDTTRFTTVANWRGAFGAIQYEGRTYGLKVHEFRKFMALPRLAAGTFEIALAIHAADAMDRRLLVESGWHLVDPGVVAADPVGFRRYVSTSGAEFTVAQGVYVDTASGWFSDRTVRYLAAGKPVLVQDTGFSRNIPVGDGLLAFATIEEAAAGALQIGRGYEAHSAAARDVAEQLFCSDRVLARFVDDCGIS